MVGSHRDGATTGKELFYLAEDNQIMCSAVKLSPIFEFTVPKPLFAIRPYYVRRISGFNDTFEAAPDGQHLGTCRGVCSDQHHCCFELATLTEPKEITRSIS